MNIINITQNNFTSDFKKLSFLLGFVYFVYQTRMPDDLLPTEFERKDHGLVDIS